MKESQLVDATSQILDAIRQATAIKAAGAESLVALAARAVDPEVHLSQSSIVETLGLHPSVVIAVTVANDLAGDTESRRDFGIALFERLKLHTHAPRLTDAGCILLAVWCLERLQPMAEVIGEELLGRSLAAARAAVSGKTPDRGSLLELQGQAEQLQRNELVGITRGASKERLGISDEERFRRHAGQALRALLQGLLEPAVVHLTTTVAGEVTRGLEAGLGFAAAAAFTIELATYLEQELPPEHLDRPPEN